MAIEGEYFPEQASFSNGLSRKDRRAFLAIMYGMFGFYAVAISGLTVALLLGTNLPRAAKTILSALH